MGTHNCNGRCIIGIVIAIIFGALFLWFLVQGFLYQSAGVAMATAFAYYLVALIFAAIAKISKNWAMVCECHIESAPTKGKKK